MSGCSVHLARVQPRRPKRLRQVFHARLPALVLIRQQQRATLAHNRLRNRVRDAPLIPHAQHNRRLALK